MLELARPFDISQPAVSRHIKVLSDAGLIAQRTEGAKRPCRLVPEAVTEIDRWLAMLREALTTNYDRLDALLAAHGLDGYFVAAHCADGHPSKPAPGMILSCLSDSGADADRAVMIGDTSFDIRMAGNAGVAAFGVAWGHHPPDELAQAGALAVARDFPELSRLIEEWAG